VKITYRNRVAYSVPSGVGLKSHAFLTDRPTATRLHTRAERARAMATVVAADAWIRRDGPRTSPPEPMDGSVPERSQVGWSLASLIAMAVAVVISLAIAF